MFTVFSLPVPAQIYIIFHAPSVGPEPKSKSNVGPVLWVVKRTSWLWFWMLTMDLNGMHLRLGLTGWNCWP